MIIPIACPKCKAKFRIDVPAIEKYKAKIAKIEAKVRDLEAVDKLKNLFGME